MNETRNYLWNGKTDCQKRCQRLSLHSVEYGVPFSPDIMVNVEEGGVVTAKIIDLGLAKSLERPGAQTAISTPGAFAGTPEFASPEQFARVPVDIRSDLYSLGSKENKFAQRPALPRLEKN